MFTDKEESNIQRILFRIVPGALRSIQHYDASKEFRTSIIVGINVGRAYSKLYMNIENITPWQLKIFNQMAVKDLPSKSFVEQHGNITRVGFKDK